MPNSRKDAALLKQLNHVLSETARSQKRAYLDAEDEYLRQQGILPPLSDDDRSRQRAAREEKDAYLDAEDRLIACMQANEPRENEDVETYMHRMVSITFGDSQ